MLSIRSGLSFVPEQRNGPLFQSQSLGYSCGGTDNQVSRGSLFAAVDSFDL